MITAVECMAVQSNQFASVLPWTPPLKPSPWDCPRVDQFALQAGPLDQEVWWGGVDRTQVFDRTHGPLQGKLYPNKKH